jgi:hypothetical protein
MSEVTSKAPETPTMVLAKLIRSKLLEAKLIPEAKGEEFLGKMVSGTASQEDWKLWLDLVPPESGEVSL